VWGVIDIGALFLRGLRAKNDEGDRQSEYHQTGIQRVVEITPPMEA
jgi:hypothetical protein